MLKQPKSLDLEKHISSRLWYTALASLDYIFDAKAEKHFSTNSPTPHFEDLSRTISSFQDEPEYKWIKLQLMYFMDKQNTANIQEQLNLEQFKTVLKLIDSIISDNVEQELLYLFETILKGKNDALSDINKLSSECLQFLESNFLLNPVLTCWLLNELLVQWPNAVSSDTNLTHSESALQDLYFRVLRTILEKSLPQNDLQKEKQVSTFRFRENRKSISEEYLKILLCILSKLEITEVKEDELLPWLFPMLLKTCNTDDVELAFYSRKSIKFLLSWHTFLDKAYLRLQDVDNLENTLNIVDVIFRLDNNSEIVFNTKELVVRIIKKKKHWLLEILDICLVLIANENYSIVSNILSYHSLKNLWPSALFRFLNTLPCIPLNGSLEIKDKNASICRALNFLLKKCEFVTTIDPVFKQLNTSLRNKLNVIMWILEHHQRKNVSLECEPIEKSLSIKKILSYLCTSSNLSALKMSINIHEENYLEILRLLENAKESTETFKAYRILLSIVKAFLSCEHENAEKNFADAKSLLNLLLPLSLRIETMENIFSLLFLRYENFDDVNQNCSGEEEGSCTDKIKLISPQENGNLKQKQFGFICNKYLTRETLHLLEKCISDTEQNMEKTDMCEDITDVQNHLKILKKAVVDAMWRLEILTSRDFVNKTGFYNLEKREESLMANESVVFDKKLRFLFRSKKKSNFYKEEDSSDGSEMRSDADGSSETGSVVYSGKRKKRLRCGNSPGDASALKNCYSNFIINFMLASKENLVLQCLWQGNCVKAEQVIEMFQLNNTRLDGEVRFSNALQILRQDLRKQETLSSETIDLNKDISKLSTLENIRQAAQGGLETSRIASQLETFLASQETNARLLSTDAISTKEIITFAVLDLTLTMSQTYRKSVNLCDIAIKYLKSCKKLENTGYFHIMSKIHQLIYNSKLNMPLTSLLCDASIPLSIKEWKARHAFWTELGERLQLFRTTQSDFENKSFNNENSLAGESSFCEIITLCGNDQNYLHKVFSHLVTVYTIFPSVGDNVGSISESMLLKDSLDSYFGHQIFDLKVEPENLEEIANKLQVNLVHSILANCCPKLTCIDNTLHGIQSNYWGRIILNQHLEENTVYPKNQDPNQCVSDLLNDLVTVLCELMSESDKIKREYILELSSNSRIRDILKRTSVISTLDLSELSVGDHTLAFFLNMWNLLFVHSILTVWAADPPFNRLRHTVSKMIIGYEIGDLGFVSLATLRQKLLGLFSWDCEFFAQTEEINEPAWQDLDVTQDRRSLFAMINEFNDSPMLRIYNPDNLDADLNKAMFDYRDHNSNQNHEEKETVWLPELAESFLNFNQENSHLPYNTSFSINDYLNKESNVTLKYEASSYEYEIVLWYTKSGSSDKRQKKTASSICYVRAVEPNILRYLEGHCWLLAYLVQRINDTTSTSFKTDGDNSARTACLRNILMSSWTDATKVLFADNQTLASIQENLSARELWYFFETAVKQNRLRNCLQLLTAIPDKVLLNNVELQFFRDKILSCLIFNEKHLDADEILQFVYQIKDINILAQTILANLKKWPVKICEDALLHALHHVEKDKLPTHCKSRMNETLCRVTIFHKMLPYCSNEVSVKDATWYDVVYCTEKTDPVHIVQLLIDGDKFELCLEWIEHQVFCSKIQSLVTQDLLIGLLKNEEEDFKHASKLLRALPQSQSLKMCKGILKRLDSIQAMRFIVRYLIEHSEPQKKTKYSKTLIGVDILDQLEKKERTFYIHLIKEPLLMLEQLLMNCKFETLHRILNIVQEPMRQIDIPIENFDKIIRFYAGKSLDFRVALQRDGNEAKVKDNSLNDSGVQNGEFVMPINVPKKEEWVPNDKARECSCCKIVIFSMFNRRHHCRRCGRVVCAVCSQHRMRVSGYPNSVLVRTCDDCKRQTASQSQMTQGVPSLASSEALECWRLTTDEALNQTVREEFSFEYVPNISLCLAILNLHSDHKAYASFLLDRCDEMKRLLQPLSGGKINREIDHALIIKMIRSLLVAAKVKCAKLGLSTGLAHCDSFLSQVDLITTLVQSGCLALIPSDELKDHALRKLRDLLTEKEQWTLALDVSTKSGLETQGVWAAWGKACLKVGYFERARDKFAHCLDKVSYEQVDDWIVLSYPEETANKSSESSKNKIEIARNRPVEDPPLLSEILQILENLSLNEQPSSNQKANIAQEISNTLNNLKAMSQGQYSLARSSSWNVENIYYQESLFYLLMYGSVSSILEFYIKQDEYDKCLTFLLENDVEAETFFNAVYLRCLKIGNLEKLLETMKSRDSTLMTWKKYLVFTCHNMEKKQLLHSLYYLQLFMKDYIRASMTCIRFYKSNASSYADLCARRHLLVNAQQHLECELKMENLSKKRRKSVSSSHSGNGSLTMEMDPLEIDKHMNTISRQLEVAKFLRTAEEEGRAIGPFLNHLLDMDTDGTQSNELPTLFGNQQEKTRLAVLTILCGRNVEEGFGIAFRIMQDYNLRMQKVYSLAGHILALEKKISSLEQLIKCCRSSGAPNSQTISDCVLIHCVKLLLNPSRSETNSNSKDQVDVLIRLINDIELKINAYIESRQLKAAYLLAVKHSRAQDIRKILKEANRLGQNAIRSICTKWLQRYEKLKDSETQKQLPKNLEYKN